MNWDDVRIFAALVRAGSLSLAGRKLKVEHSTVVRRIDSLEKALGLRLFDRLPRGWQLTAEGEQLFVRAEQMEESAHAFLREASEGAELSGTVRLSVLPAFSTAFLVPQLALNREKWSPITLELVAETRLASLTRREADLAIRLGRPQDPGLATRPLGALSYGLFAQQAYLAQHQPEHWRFIGFDESLRDAPEQHWLDKFAGCRAFSFKSNSTLSLYEATVSGLGVAALPHFLAMKNPDLVPIATDPSPPPREMWLVVHPEVRRSAKVRLIADLVTEIITSAKAVLFQNAAGGLVPPTPAKTCRIDQGSGCN
ncbi:MAG: LysR family transcriptional regulator [Noviherbaspirillum sp.]